MNVPWPCNSWDTAHPVAAKNGDGLKVSPQRWENASPAGARCDPEAPLLPVPRAGSPGEIQVFQPLLWICGFFNGGTTGSWIWEFHFLFFQSYSVVPCRYLFDTETAPHFWKAGQIQNSNSTVPLLESLAFPSLLRNKFVPLQLYPSYPSPIHFLPMLNPRSLTEEVKHKSSHQWWWSVPKAWFSELNSSIQGTEAFNKTCGAIF